MKLLKVQNLVIISTLLLLVLGNYGCGWRLRGQIALPPDMERTFLKGAAPYSELGVVLQNKLKGADAGLVSERNQATAILHILADKVDKRVLSIDSTGRASEYELNYILRFMLTDKSGKTLVAEQTVTTVRELSYDSDNVLSTSDEEQRLKKDMVRFGVQQMLRRINISLKQAG